MLVYWYYVGTLIRWYVGMLVCCYVDIILFYDYVDMVCSYDK
jgi:hypothetical protein